MTCAKQIVKAEIITTDGESFKGENSCKNPQEVCPRDIEGYASGEGYHLCKEVCEQESHAEIDAISKAGDKCEGATLYLTGHTYACDSCKGTAGAVGIKEIIIK